MLLLKDLLWLLDGFMNGMETPYYYGCFLVCYVSLWGSKFATSPMGLQLWSYMFHVPMLG